MATEHRHTYTVTDTQPAPEGISGLARQITIGCSDCDESRKTITEKSDLLLMFYAKQLDPSFRENYQPVDVKVSGRIDINDSARERLAERLMAAIEHP